MSFIKDNKKNIGILSIVFAVMLGIGALLGGQLNNLFLESVATKEIKGKPINILFMGIDARDAKSNSRSDTLILACIDPSTQKTAMVSIPRDTRIKNSSGHYDKINSINLLDGPEAACKEVGKLLDVSVDYYVITNFAGFGDIVDALGGVHINVESNMYHADPVNPELAINLSKGYQYLNGKQALAYVRYRGGATADIGRTENQQKFIKALAQEMLKTKTILKLPELIPQINKNVRTNLPLKDMIYLANMAQKLDMTNINAQTLPGYFLHDNTTGASYWEADQKVAKVLVASLLKGETFKVVGDTPADKLPVSPASAAVEEKKEEPLKSTTDATIIMDKGNVIIKNGSTTKNSIESVDNSKVMPVDNKNEASQSPSSDKKQSETVNTTLPSQEKSTVSPASAEDKSVPQINVNPSPTKIVP